MQIPENNVTQTQINDLITFVSQPIYKKQKYTIRERTDGKFLGNSKKVDIKGNLISRGTFVRNEPKELSKRDLHRIATGHKK